MKRILVVLLLLILIFAILWFLNLVPLPQQNGQESRGARLLNLPHDQTSLRVEQRTQETIPGSRDRLYIHLGDITRGQVEMTLGDTEGGAPIPSRSVREGDRIDFQVAGYPYVLFVDEFETHVMAADAAHFLISQQEEAPGTREEENRKIARLIERVGETDLVFIRNGTEHSAGDAAKHMKRKWDYAGDRIRTLDQFIEKLASHSSNTGKPYRVRLPEGQTLLAGVWLRKLAKELEEEEETKGAAAPDADAQ